MNSKSHRTIKVDLNQQFPKFYEPAFTENLEIQIRPRKKIIRVKIN